MPGGTHDAVESEIQMGDDVAVQEDDHILPGIRQGVAAGPEETQNGIEPHQRQDHKKQSGQHIQGEGISQYLVGGFIPLSSEEHRHHRRAADTDQRTEGGGQVHQRESDRQARYRQGADTTADEYAVDDIIQRRSRHRDDGGNRISAQKRRYIFRPQFEGYVRR